MCNAYWTMFVLYYLDEGLLAAVSYWRILYQEYPTLGRTLQNTSTSACNGVTHLAVQVIKTIHLRMSCTDDTCCGLKNCCDYFHKYHCIDSVTCLRLFAFVLMWEAVVLRPHPCDQFVMIRWQCMQLIILEIQLGSSNCRNESCVFCIKYTVYASPHMFVMYNMCSTCHF